MADFLPNAVHRCLLGLMKSTPGVNFTNVLRAAFTRADLKSAIKLLNLTVFFAILGSTCVKAPCRTLVKLTPSG